MTEKTLPTESKLLSEANHLIGPAVDLIDMPDHLIASEANHLIKPTTNLLASPEDNTSQT
jgi:hypothetical protein